MAQQFNLTAQINLQSPKNVGKVVSDIRRQLQGSGLNTVNIKVKADARSMAQTNKQLQNVSKSSKAAAKDIGTLNRNLQEATRRFGVITLATGTLLSFVTGLKNSTKAAIEFERELIKISQVTGKSVQQLQSLTKEVTRLSTAFGVSSADLLNVSRTLAQAGFNAEKTRKSLDILAKTTLAATFDNIQDTTEGAIALLRQFGDEAKRTGGDVAFLEKSLSAINSVSKKFAVESGDLITVIRRVGGVFSAAGGEINELIALFTSVRATTRESAETIATGLRTIFTRIQRTDTIDALKNLNIELRDSQGNFVGAYEAVRRLSIGLASIDPKSATFSDIAEQLGGFRQIGKVIPLIQQFTTAQDALRVAQGASGSVAKDAATAQQGLGVQIQKVKEEFTALIRKFSDSGPFNSIATGALKVATAMIKVAEAVEPLLPLLLTMFGLKLGRSLAPGLASLAGIGRGRGGTGTGGFSRFATGGVVPGSGNRDTVPAMLTPGEFVIKKSSVKKLGTDKLHQMNNNRFSGGNDKRGVKRGQGEDKKRGRFKVLPSGGQTHFAHLDKMGQPSRDFQNLLKKKDPNIKAKAIYSNFGIDIPGTWNMDWGQQRNGSFIKDNEGATKSALASFVKDRDIFKSLRKRKKVYKFRGEGSEQAQDIISDKPKMREVRNSFAAKIKGSKINNFDVDPDVIRADIGGMLLKSFKDVPGVQSTKIIPFMKQASAYRLQGDSNRRSVAGEGIKEDGLKAASKTRRLVKTLKSRDANRADAKAVSNTIKIKEYNKNKRLKKQELLKNPHFSEIGKRLGVTDLDAQENRELLSKIINSQRFAAGGQVRADQLRLGDILNSGETVDQKMKVGNKQRRQIQLMLAKDGQSRRERVDLDKMFGVKTRGEKMGPLKFAAGGQVRADQLRLGDILNSGETVDQKMKVGNKQRRQIQLMLAKDGQSRRERVDLDKMFGVKTRGEKMGPLKFAAGGQVRADQLRLGDILNSGETVDQKMKVGNRQRRQIQLMLAKDGQSRRERVDLDKMFGVKTRGKDMSLKLASGGVVQKFAGGGSAQARKNAYIFDFDDTLATTEAKSFKDFSNPDFIESASATRYASLAKRRASQGDDVHVLTARSGSKKIRGAIASFMAKNGIPTKSIMGVGKAFPKEREPGKRPGTTRKLSTASKKQRVLQNLAKRYGEITFLDDNVENILKASQVQNVNAVTAEKKKLFKKFEIGGKVGIFDSDTIEDKTQANAMRKAILDSKKIKNLIWGPAGAGKSTYAKDMYGDKFLKSTDHLGEYDEFIVLSGAQNTKKATKVGGKNVNLSQATVDLIREAKDITAIIPEQELLLSRRQKRIDNPESVRSMGDKRSLGSLKASMHLANEKQSNEILKTFQGLKSGISVLRPTMANPSGKTIEAPAGAIAATGGRIEGTTGKTKGMTLEEAAASGLKRSQLSSGFPVASVDAFFGGTAAENQAASRKAAGAARKKKGATDSNLTYGAAFLEKVTASASGERSVDVDGKKVLYDFKTAYVDPTDSKKIKDDYVAPQAMKAVNSIAGLFANSVGAKATKSKNIPNLPAITGSLYEAGLARVVGGGIADDADDNRIFDFPGGLKDAAGVFGADGKALQNIKTDAKVTSSSSALKSIRAKVKNDLSKNKFAKGGAAPSDTVPALLTPGEFVFNADSAKKIGYSNLNRMNKQGVQGYAAGGVVSTGRNNYGTPPSGGFGAGVFPPGQDAASYAAVDIKWDSINKEIEKAAAVNAKNTKVVETNNKARAKASKGMEAFSKRLASAKTGLREFGGSVARGLGRLEGIANSAQSFVFLAMTIGTVTSQLSGLSDTTKTAINRTATFFSTMIGIGATVVSTLASVTSALLINKAATDAESSAKVKNAGLTYFQPGGAPAPSGGGKGAGGIGALLGKLAGPLTIVIGLFSVAAVAISFYNNKLIATTEKLGKAAGDLAAKLKETGEGAGETFSAILKAAQSADQRTFFGGAQAGAVASDVLRNTRLTGSRAARAKEIDSAIRTEQLLIEQGGGNRRDNPNLLARRATIGGLREERGGLIFDELNVGLQEAINSFADLVKESKELSTAYSDLESRSSALSPEDKRSELLDLSSRRSDLINTAIESAKAQLPTAISGATSDKAIKASGGSAQVFFTSLEKAASGDAKGTGFDKRTAATLSLVFAQLSSAVKESEIAVKQSRVNVDEFAKTIDGSKTKAEIMSGEFGKVAKASRDSILALGDAQAAELMARAKVAREIGDDTTAASLTKQAREVRFAANERAAREREYHENIAQAAIDRHQAEMASIAATQKIVEEQKRILGLIASIDEDITTTKRGTKDIQNLTTLRGGGSIQASATRLTNTDLSSVVTEGQRTQLSDEMSQMIANADPARRAGLQKSADQIKAVAKGVGELNQGTDTTDGLIGNRRGLTTDDIKNRLQSSLGDIPEEVLNQIVADLDKAGDEIDPQELANALSKYTDLTNKHISIFGKLTDSEQSKLEKNRAFLDSQEQLYQQELKGRANIAAGLEQAADIALRFSKILAQSRGEERQIRKNIAAAEGRRIDLAQGNLDEAGVRIDAGDIDGLSAEGRRLREERARIVKEITEAKKGTEEKIKLEKEQAANRKQIKSVNVELARLADQSGRVDDLFSEMSANVEMIEKERRKREQVIGVVEDFVVGGQKTRKALVDSANGIRLAFATGTLQNQSEEQRSSTIGLLEKLSDVPLLNGFTGKEIKQELIFRDAIRLGLDPKIAQMLATATTKEQQLIDSNERLAFQLFLLTQEMAQARDTQGALGLANGGMVQYRAGGGSIFKPRGTDTVPAMLTPGEFVIQKSAVDRIGADNLAAMNGGGTAYHRKGGIVSYFNGGGSVEDMKSFIDKYINDMKKISVDQSTLGGVDSSGSFTAADYNPALNRMRIGPRSDVQTIEHEALHFISSLISELGDRHGKIPADSGLYKYIQQKLLDKRGFDIEEDTVKFMAKGASSRMDRLLGMDFKGVPGKRDALGFPSSTARKALKASGAFREEYAVARALGSTEGYDPSDVHLGSSLNTLSKLDNFMISAGMKGLTHQPSNDLKMLIYKKLQETLGELNPYVITEGGGIGVNLDAPLRNSEIFKKKPKFKLAEPKPTPAAEKAAESEAKNKAKTEDIRTTPVKPTPAPAKPTPASVDDPFGILSPQSPGVDEDAQAKRNKKAKLQIGPDGEVSSVTDRDRAVMSPKDSKPTPYDKRDRASTRRDEDEYYRRRQKGQGGDVPKSSVPTPYDKRDRASTIRDEDAYYRRRKKSFTSTPPATDVKPEIRPSKPMRYGYSDELERPEYQEYRDFIESGGDPRSSKAKNIRKKNRRESLGPVADFLGEDFVPDPHRPLPNATQEEKEAYFQKRLLKKLETAQGSSSTPSAPTPSAPTPSAPTPSAPTPPAPRPPAPRPPIDSELAGDPRIEFSDPHNYDSLTKKQYRPITGYSTAPSGNAEYDAQVEAMFGDKNAMEMNAPTTKSPEELAKIREEYKARKKRERGQRTTSRDRFRNRMGYDTGSNFSGPQLPPGQRQQNSASSRFRDRITPRDERGTPAQLERRRQTTQEGQVQTDASGSVIHKARYERLLRTSGPVIAKRYADTVGYVPPTGSRGGRGGRGITRPFGGQSQQQQGGSSTDQLLQQLMQQMLNKGRQQRPEGFASGGSPAGSDVIPAMLTPGEFVMSAGAVRQHGVGAMKSLNRGQVPRYNRGGMVGGVQYRQGGGFMSQTMSGAAGMMGIDTKEITSVLDGFVGGFSSTLDTITTAFSPITSAIQGLISVFGGADGFKWDHTFNGSVVLSGATNLSPEALGQIQTIIENAAKDKVPESEFKPGN